MTAKIVTTTENLPYEDWLEFRKKGVGGSDAAVVCGINKYKSPVELWMEKTNRMSPQEAGESAYWGTRLESLIRDEFTKRTGIEVKVVNQLLQSNEHPFMLANLDGVCYDDTHGDCIFEAKTASAFKAGDWENSIPDEYMLQVQHYMAVTGFKAAYIAVLIGGNTFKWRFIERDEEIISALIQLEADFWECVKNDTPPPLDGSDASAKFLAEKFSESTKTQIELPEEADEIIKEYLSASERLTEITEEKQLAENRLKRLLGENEVGIVGKNIVSWKAVSQERLDSKTLKSEHPTLYKKYANTTTYRRFSIKSAD
ncbi:MAG: YqaJ viral recombinase family protein [Lachnospiraceae bacterium]|nr:YqaJ viral recombinase family protein [Ruminococcus sp.]MCM1276825.1 YqaJ viral recombinase family protein [Lachnospiraceae bacterium]